MCCRYYIEPANPELLSIAEAAEHTKLMERFRRAAAQGMQSRGEITPSMIVPVIAWSKSGGRAYFPMKWGYHVERKNLLANARLETAAVKPVFQESWKSHRCIIPASYYFEWEHFLRPNGKKETGEKYLLQPKGAQITWLCGLYRLENGLPHFVILTRPPGEGISYIHDRMPLLLEEKDVESWINPACSPDEIAYRAVTDLYFQKAG